MNNQQTNSQNLARYIDHTNLSPTASQEVIIKLCNEALEYGFRSVCIHPSYIELANKLLKDTDVLVCTVVGFPLGQNTTLSKIFETVDAVNKGADEIDMVINIADLKARNNARIINEINRVALASGNRTLKVIVETCLLSYEDKLYAVEIISKTKATYIKTSTGFSAKGAEIDDIKLWKKWISEHLSPLLIKAAGGIRNHQDLIDFIAAGSSRIGTSKGIELLSDTQTETICKNDNDKKTLNLDLNYKDIDEVAAKKNKLESDIIVDQQNENINTKKEKLLKNVKNTLNIPLVKEKIVDNDPANNKNLSSPINKNKKPESTSNKKKQSNSY